ncbi:MAG: PilZ domain-containing protein [Phycisphaerales bacterium]|nr:PilZ domain-containing protein [Phycisphaerales bacterium]
MECRDLLRIDQVTYESVITELRASAVPTVDSRRRDERVPYALPSAMVVIFHYESVDEREAFQVRPFDLSPSGMGILHGQFVYQSTPVMALMKNLGGQVERVTGKVAHTRLVRGRIHAIGITFDERLDLSRFISKSDPVGEGHPAQVLRDWTDLVKVPPREVDRILRDIDNRAARCERAKNRAEARHCYRGNAMLVVFNPENADTRAKFRVIPSDLSAGGVGFLHGTFVHPGTPCQLILSDLHGQSRVVRGLVVRCELAKGRVHAVGVKFEHPIDLNEFRESDEGHKAA